MPLHMGAGPMGSGCPWSARVSALFRQPGPCVGKDIQHPGPGHHQGSPLRGWHTHLGSRLGALGPGARNLSSRGLQVPTYRMGRGGPVLGSRDSGALEPLPRSGMAGVPHPHDSQAGRAATEVVTRLLMPRVLRVPRRRPQVKARNWGQGAQVTVGKRRLTPRTGARPGFGLHGGLTPWPGVRPPWGWGLGK